MNYDPNPPTLPREAGHLFVACSSFPPFVWELKERVYPNKILAASRDPAAIQAVARLYYR